MMDDTRKGGAGAPQDDELFTPQGGGGGTGSGPLTPSVAETTEGKAVILPVDQGFEHGPARSFAPNPPAYDPHYHFHK